VNNEIAALNSAISTYGVSFTSLVTGISVGSEDLYRISPTGIAAKSGYGADPNTLVSYINQIRSALVGTPLDGVKIGHVDTWTAWVNGSNSAVVNAVDWIGMDAYPYFQNTMSNGIDNGANLFFDAYDATVAAAGGKDVWITETGWPVSGATENLAVPSTQNAKTYWDQVGCARAFGKINTYWFTLQDAYPTTPNPSFGIVGTTLSTTPLYDLSCSSVSSSSAPSSTSSSSSPAESATNAASSSASPTLAATGGSGLTPPQGIGNGGTGNTVGNSPTVTGATTMSTSTFGMTTSVATISSNGTYIVTTMTAPATAAGTSKASSTSTSPATVSTNGAIQSSVSLAAGGLAAVLALMATL
jgi:glucan endo-1,3-beta-D-glucosidase